MIHNEDSAFGETAAPVHPTGRAVVNVAALGVVLVVNGLAGSGGLSGASIGALAEAYPNDFLPAGWVFGIWSLIYLGLTGFAVHQARPSQRDSPVLGRLGWAWVVNAGLNVLWIAAFSFRLFLPALAVMVALLVNLVVVNERIGYHDRRLGTADRLLVAYPFVLYLAWISVAVIANAFHYATVVGWDGFGIAGSTWSPVMMAVATGLGAFLVVHRGAWPVPLVVVWALLGIRDRGITPESVKSWALILSAVALLTVPVGLWWRRRRGATVVVP